jgi:hypothetical protein
MYVHGFSVKQDLPGNRDSKPEAGGEEIQLKLRGPAKFFSAKQGLPNISQKTIGTEKCAGQLTSRLYRNIPPT